jgi:coatomer subunit delta
MVLLAAAICSKDGKALLSRQFVEMSRPRIEGLLAAFPKLVGTGKQHTFVETESVRYVYQPLDKLYVLLVTTKASNILEDLETLRLFARVIPEYSRGTQESDVINNTFEIMFAFDEIVALGYRENVNLAQIRTFTEMDSHEEREAKARRDAQEREAKENMKRKAKELTQQRREAAKRGGVPRSGYSGFGSGGISSEGISSDMSSMNISSTSYGNSSMSSSTVSAPSAAAARRPTTAGPNKAMKLGAKGRDFDGIAPLLQAEDPSIGRIPVTTSPSASGGKGGVAPATGTGASAPAPAAQQEGIHCRIEEKINLQANRDGGLKNMELSGILQVRINHPDFTEVKVRVDSRGAANSGAQLQTHPNIDKQMFHTKSVIQAKAGGKPYPIGQEVGVLKWRLQTQEESSMPFTINCWPNEAGNSCEVNIEYELQDTSLELQDVAITIPLPHGNQSPTVSECEGTYECDSRNTRIIWRLPLVDADNRSGTMEFTIKGGHTDDFFPVTVSFHSQRSYCGMQILDALNSAGNNVKFSCETSFFPEKYEVA